MSKLTPDIFVGWVMTAIETIDPQLAVERLDELSLRVGEERLDLENLWRIVRENPSAAKRVISRYCEEVLVNAPNALTDLEEWVEVKPRIMPRIHPVTLFERLERSLVAYRPWVNGTIVTFVCDGQGSTISLRRDQIEQWQVSIEDLDAIALQNLDRYAALPKLEATEIDGGKLVVVTMRDGYDSSRILLEGWQLRLGALLGPTFYAGIPARDMLIAFSIEPKPFVERVAQRLKTAFERVPYPISPHSFLVTPDGIAGTIATTDEDDAW